MKCRLDGLRVETTEIIYTALPAFIIYICYKCTFMSGLTCIGCARERERERKGEREKEIERGGMGEANG